MPGKTPVFTIWEHASRYRFARPFVSGKTILDAGCGDGYGTYYLSRHAHSVTGVDVSVEAIADAQIRYSGENVSYLAMDCRELAFPDRSFDAVCSFEVIEHIDSAPEFLAGVHRVLADDGAFILSTPNRKRTSGQNPFHVQEYEVEEFIELLSPHFSQIELYGQFCNRPVREFLFNQSYRLWMRSRLYRRMILGLAPLYFRGLRSAAAATDPDWVEKVGPGTFEFRRKGVEKAHYLVAVCRKAPSNAR